MSDRHWSTARQPDLEDDLDILIGDLCVLWGYCNQLGGDDLVRDFSVLSGEEFGRAVLAAEGMDPDTQPGWVRQIARVFEVRYGPTASAADFTPFELVQADFEADEAKSRRR